MLLSIVYWLIALLFIGIGLSAMLSKKPAGLYSNIKPPKLEKIKDLKAYNRAVGLLIMGYGILFLLLGFVTLSVSENTAGILIMLCAFPGAIAMMIIYEVVISSKYIGK